MNYDRRVGVCLHCGKPMQVGEQNNIIITWWSASLESVIDLIFKICTSILFFGIYITLHLQQNNA